MTIEKPWSESHSHMRVIQKFFLISGIFLCFALIGLSGMGLYLYHHPDRIKPMIERSLSGAVGASCTMETFSFSLHPMVVEAGGISVKNRNEPKPASSIVIPFIRTEMAIEGPWGGRTLILKNMRITGIVVDGALPAILPVKKAPSFSARMVQGLVGLFFFRDIRFQSGEILDGHIVTTWGGQTIQAHHIHAKVGADEPLFVSFAMEVENSFRHLHVTAPSVTLVGNNTFDVNDVKFNGALKATDITLQDAELGIQRMDVQSTVAYNHAHKQVTAEKVDVRIHGLALMGKTDGRMPLIDLGLQAERISTRYPVIEITNGTLQIPRAGVPRGTPDIPIGDIRFAIPDGRMDMENRTLALPKVRFEAFGLKNLLLAVDLKVGSINLMLQGEKTALLQAAVAHHLLPSNLNFSAGDSFRIEVAGPEGGPWQVRANVSLTDLGFQNKDGSLVGEKISLATEAQGIVDLQHSRMTVVVDAKADAGEALYDRYYLNLAQNPLVVSCNGTYRFQQQFLQISRLRFDLTDILPFEIKGSLTPAMSIRDADLTVSIPRTPVKPIFHYLLQEPYKTEKPFLAAMETGGTVSAEWAVKKKENAWRVMGRLGWREGSLTMRDRGISMTGIQLDLPVWYQTGFPEAPVDRLKGACAVTSVVSPPLPEQPLKIVLDAGPNWISVDSPTVIRVPGGDLRLGAVQVKNLFSSDVSVHTRLAFDEINLGSLLSGFGAFPPDGAPEGHLTGILDPVRYEKHTVTSQGEMAVTVFGGKIVLSDLGASGILTSAPVLTFNAGWDDLLLTEMTTDTTFGKIEGVLRGHIRDFEIAYGQPQRFDLLLETVKKKGTPQTISIAAIDNITRIGGGQSPFMGFAGAVASVFDKFPYEKIGIRARLENDMFIINGTIREDGVEYIVKRRGFSGVDIVNQNPDNRINFKDMVKRIQRIAHKGGAVIQ